MDQLISLLLYLHIVMVPSLLHPVINNISIDKRLRWLVYLQCLTGQSIIQSDKQQLYRRVKTTVCTRKLRRKWNKDAQLKKLEESMNTKHFFYLTYLLIWVIHRRVSADYNTTPLLKTDMLKDRETVLSAMNGNIYCRDAQTFDLSCMPYYKQICHWSRFSFFIYCFVLTFSVKIYVNLIYLDTAYFQPTDITKSCFIFSNLSLNCLNIIHKSETYKLPTTRRWLTEKQGSPCETAHSKEIPILLIKVEIYAT